MSNANAQPQTASPVPTVTLDKFKYDLEQSIKPKTSSLYGGGLVARHESTSEKLNITENMIRQKEINSGVDVNESQQEILSTELKLDVAISNKKRTRKTVTKKPSKKSSKVTKKKQNAPKSITARLALRYKTVENSSESEDIPESNEEGDLKRDVESEMNDIPFTQIARKQHIKEFNLMAKLSGKKHKSAAMSTLSSKISSRKSRQEYQQTFFKSPTISADESSSSGKEKNNMIVLEKQAANNRNVNSTVSFNAILSPQLGVSIISSACLSFPYIPQSTRSIDNLESIDMLLSRYSVGLPAPCEVPKNGIPFCSFTPSKPEDGIWNLSQLPPNSLTKNDVINLHKSDDTYFDFDFELARKRRCITMSFDADMKLGSDISHITASDFDEYKELTWSTEEESPFEIDEIPASDADEYEEIQFVSESYCINHNITTNSSPVRISDVPIDTTELLESPLKNPGTMLLPIESENNLTEQVTQEHHIKSRKTMINETGCLVHPVEPSANESKSSKSSPLSPLALRSSLNKPSALDTIILNSSEISPSPDLHHATATPPIYHFEEPESPTVAVEIIEIPESPYGSGNNSQNEDYFELFENAVSRFEEKVADVKVLQSPQVSKKGFDLPEFNKMTTSQLRDQLDKWGFKPVKTRKAMLELLQSCKVSTEVPTLMNEQGTSLGLLPSNPGAASDLSTGELKKLLNSLGIKHNGSRSRMVEIVNKCYSEFEKKNDDGTMTDAMRSNISLRISELLRQEPQTINSLWTRILCYEPISLDELSTFLEKKLNMKFDLKFVRNWCDLHGITTTTAE